MARRRGFIAEYQYQQRKAQARARSAQARANATARANAAAQAQVLKAQAAAARAAVAASRATEAERKRLEREAQAAYVESRQAEVTELNELLAEEYAEIDGLLAATLAVDDWVDLESLKQTVEHPPFPRWDLEAPQPRPARLAIPDVPQFVEPEPPRALFGKRKKHDELIQQARLEHERSMRDWAAYRDSIPARQAEIDGQYAAAEAKRTQLLQIERARYESQCRVRENEVAEHNSKIDALIAGLGYGVTEAVQEYVGIVLANSVYPEVFEVDHEAEFNPETAELELRVTVPEPSAIKAVKAYRYVKASDEIAETALSKRDANERYGSALNQIALRSLHEIFEADRRGLIQAISLEVGPRTKDPATGHEIFLPLIAVSCARGTFLELELSGVIPAATLQHLGAAVSKNPIGLATIDPAGVRRV